MFREGPIFLFGDRPLLALHLCSLVGGATAGAAFGKEMKVAGLICGMLAASGATALFSYYAFYPPAKESMRTSETLLTLGIGGAPGVGLFFLIKKARGLGAG